jgi:uncharacterized protein (DUF58 family)
VGLGESFWQFRPYQAGDTIDRVDWRQSAKGDRLYIRETEWAAAQTVWLWRDAGPGMAYRSSAALPTKQERAELLLLALAALLLRGGERAGLLGSGQAPSSGRGALDAILAGLDRATPLAAAQRPVSRHATLVLFGDFLDPIDEIVRARRRASALSWSSCWTRPRQPCPSAAASASARWRRTRRPTPICCCRGSKRCALPIWKRSHASRRRWANSRGGAVGIFSSTLPMRRRRSLYVFCIRD